MAARRAAAAARRRLTGRLPGSAPRHGAYEGRWGIKALIVTAPEPLRDQLRGLTVRHLIATCAAWRPDRGAHKLAA
ncbi:hypothetical protein GCM10023193_43290 [Planotetraspora kaengkrachanensis]|uniref:Uncharacterized protein n=1 Tax=Planotetraspora kaengkrachanensis TaxID=575193 RepID=A0A8J3M1E2_9ACTN|nr:hypothetical protein Pka01_34950 [Planotetraspora kaengkrachanensis]